MKGEKTMMDNIALGGDAQANHALALLREEERDGALAEHVHFLPGVELRADPALGLQGEYRAPRGVVLDLKLRPTGQGDWCALHLALPAQDLRGKGVIGFALRGAAPEMRVLRACIRSGTKKGFVDCFFDKHILLRPEDSSHVDAFGVGQRADLPMQAPWRELILFLPPLACDLSLTDLRLFLV